MITVIILIVIVVVIVIMVIIVVGWGLEAEGRELLERETRLFFQRREAHT